MKIHKQLVEVTKKIASEGIGKTRKNQQQGYQFRGIDEVMNAFAPILAEHGLYLHPRYTEREVSERATKSGGALFYVTVKGEFDFVNDEGEKATVGPFYGEAMDSADKATNKAMAVAFKYAMFQTFCVPIEGVTGGDADAVTHEVAAKVKPTDGAWEAMGEEEQAWLLNLAAKVRDYFDAGDVAGAHDHIEAQQLVSEEKIALWSRLDSKVRSALKKEKESRNARN